MLVLVCPVMYLLSYIVQEATADPNRNTEPNAFAAVIFLLAIVAWLTGLVLGIVGIVRSQPATKARTMAVVGVLLAVAQVVILALAAAATIDTSS